MPTTKPPDPKLVAKVQKFLQAFGPKTLLQITGQVLHKRDKKSVGKVMACLHWYQRKNPNGAPEWATRGMVGDQEYWGYRDPTPPAAPKKAPKRAKRPKPKGSITADQILSGELEDN